MGKSGKKKNAADYASLKGKKPTNKGMKKTTIKRNPGHIRNKLKRSEMYGKYLLEKKAQKREARLKRIKDVEALGEDNDEEDNIPSKKQTPRTIDNTREIEQTLVQANDEEIQDDENDDEFIDYFNDTIRPKILITTRPYPSKEIFYFISDLQQSFIPKCFYYPRKSYNIKEICRFASNKQFTHLIVLSEKDKKCNGMTISHLRSIQRIDDETGLTITEEVAGPTAFFKVSNVIQSSGIKNHGSCTSHIPELNLHGFSTRLGHRIGRFLGSLFPHNTQFQGRQVVTFHNQRDYIFVRHHRYIFEKDNKKDTTSNKKEEEDTNDSKDKTNARLQELGPRFTLKLKWLQEGTFDTKYGEYEWIHKRKEMDLNSRRKFHL